MKATSGICLTDWLEPSRTSSCGVKQKEKYFIEKLHTGKSTFPESQSISLFGRKGCWCDLGPDVFGFFLAAFFDITKSRWWNNSIGDASTCSGHPKLFGGDAQPWLVATTWLHWLHGKARPHSPKGLCLLCKIFNANQQASILYAAKISLLGPYSIWVETCVWKGPKRHP